MTNNVMLDHFMWVTPELDETVSYFSEISGVPPVWGGVHPGVGTKNYLISLGPGRYLEIMGPDYDQDMTGKLGGNLAKLEKPTLFTYALRTLDISASFARAAQHGFTAIAPTGEPVPGPLAMSRSTPDGSVLKWDLLMLGSHPFGMFLPFFIQWRTDLHPSATSPLGCSVSNFWIGHPNPKDLSDAQTTIGWTGVEVRLEDPPSFHLQLDTPRGVVRL